MYAITLSRQMMHGHKWNTFMTELSIIGWDLLSALTLCLPGVFYVNPYKDRTGPFASIRSYSCLSWNFARPSS